MSAQTLGVEKVMNSTDLDFLVCQSAKEDLLDEASKQQRQEATVIRKDLIKIDNV